VLACLSPIANFPSEGPCIAEVLFRVPFSLSACSCTTRWALNREFPGLGHGWAANDHVLTLAGLGVIQHALQKLYGSKIALRADER
jgi:hypothetical protein